MFFLCESCCCGGCLVRSQKTSPPPKELQVEEDGLGPEFLVQLRVHETGDFLVQLWWQKLSVKGDGEISETDIFVYFCLKVAKCSLGFCWPII